MIRGAWGVGRRGRTQGPPVRGSEEGGRRKEEGEVASARVGGADSAPRRRGYRARCVSPVRGGGWRKKMRGCASCKGERFFGIIYKLFCFTTEITTIEG